MLKGLMALKPKSVPKKRTTRRSAPNYSEEEIQAAMKVCESMSMHDASVVLDVPLSSLYRWYPEGKEKHSAKRVRLRIEKLTTKLKEKWWTKENLRLDMEVGYQTIATDLAKVAETEQLVRSGERCAYVYKIVDKVEEEKLIELLQKIDDGVNSPEKIAKAIIDAGYKL